MTMFRISKDKNNPYVMLNKQFINDARLSAKAKGILAYLLSLPDDWQIYESEITKHFSDGLKSINSGIKELIYFGYIERQQLRGERGQFAHYEYAVHEVCTETPKQDSGTETPKTENGETVNGKAERGKGQTTNNNQTNKKITNNESSNIYLSFPTDDPFLFIYNGYFLMKFRKEHMKIEKKSYIELEEWITELVGNGIMKADWEKAVKTHFEKLSKSNNGNILAFMAASKRWFDVDPPHVNFMEG